MAPRDVETNAIASPAAQKDPLEAHVTQTKPNEKPIHKNHLWFIHNKAYDLRDFVYAHPGTYLGALGACLSVALPFPLPG